MDLGEISARGVDRIVRMSWTLADLAGVDRPGQDEIGVRARPVAGGGSVTGPDEPQRRALAALSFLADPADRALGALLRHRTASEVLAAITEDEAARQVILSARREVPGLGRAVERWRKRVALLPTKAKLARRGSARACG